jgi:cyclopropane fatty-acyl-phospholipid synthase-like methyltransferase
VNINSSEWVDKWSKDLYDPMCIDFYIKGYGSDKEPYSSIWMSSLANGMGDFFKDGMKILDYGCGAGRFYNFLSRKIKDFSYIGVEKPCSNHQFGEKSIETARKIFEKDKRGKFGLIGTELEDDAIASVDVVVLGSIFTHISYTNMQIVCDKFLSVLDRGGAVVFSIFIEDKYREKGAGEYGLKNSFRSVFYTKDQILSYCQKRSVKINEVELFVSPSGKNHKIFRMEK